MSRSGFIARSSPRAYARGMLRLLACLAAALALFLAPFAMTGAGGMAIAHAAPAQAGRADGHCGGGRPASGEREADLNLGCAGACAALAPACATAAFPPMFAAMGDPKVPERLLTGAFVEAETPPPRSSAI